MKTKQDDQKVSGPVQNITGETGHITDFDQGASCAGDRCAAGKHGGAMQPNCERANHYASRAILGATGSTGAALDRDEGGKSCCFSTRLAQRHVSECG